MEYADDLKRSVNVNTNGPHQHVLQEQIANDEFEMESLLQDVNAVHQMLLALYPDMEIDPNMVFEQLEVVKHNPSRIYHVTSLLGQLHKTFLNNKEQRDAAVHLEKNEAITVVQDAVPEVRNAKALTVRDEKTAIIADGNGHPVITIEDDDTSTIKPAPGSNNVYGALVQDVDLIIDVFPDADPQEVYAYLEARRNEPQRVANVIEELIHRRPIEKVTVSADVPPTQQNVPLHLDEERKRIGDAVDAKAQIPLKKLRMIQDGPEAESKSPSVLTDRGEELVETSNMSPEGDASTSSAVPACEPGMSDQEVLSRLQVLKETFPDADREYLSELVKSCGNDEARLQATVSDMLEKREYPKLKDQLERERKQALKKEYSSRKFTPEEVLQWFEDPIAFFSDSSSPVSKNYEMHAYAQLNNEFPKLVLNDIKRALINNNQHYTGAFHELKERLQEECKMTKFKRRKARAIMMLPEEPDELFYKELAFTRIEDKLKDYLQAKELQRTKRMEEAKASDALVTCACCYDEENLPEDMIDCGASHLFCKECVRRGAEVAIGDGKNGLDCMSDKCGFKFELPALQQVLKPSTFSNLLKRIQAEEISNAGIPDLVQCPHCSFAAIMPNQEDKVFRCLNPECLKETCRFCKEPNHIPLRCEEVEKSDEVKMRTYIENKMTDALVRKCYRCSRRFMKEEGCNKMTCVCGATMCYVCRQPIKDYQHFQSGGCPQMSDTVKLHHDEVIQGAEQARKEFVEQHPELKNTQLKHDPAKDLLNGRPVSYPEHYEDDDYYEHSGTDHDDYSEDDYNYYDEESDESRSDADESSGVTNGSFLDPSDQSAMDEDTRLNSEDRSLAASSDSDGSTVDHHLISVDSTHSEDEISDRSNGSNFVDPGSASDVSYESGLYSISPSTSSSANGGARSMDSERSMSDAERDSVDEVMQDFETCRSASSDSGQNTNDSPSLLLSENSHCSSGSRSYISCSDESRSFNYMRSTSEASEESANEVRGSSGQRSNDSALRLDSESSCCFSGSDSHTAYSDGLRSENSVRTMSETNDDSSNDFRRDFETCSAASPSSGHGTNDTPSSLLSDDSHGSTDSPRNFATSESDTGRGNSAVSPSSAASTDSTDEYSFSDTDDSYT